jgi:hypothetical protein
MHFRHYVLITVKSDTFHMCHLGVSQTVKGNIQSVGTDAVKGLESVPRGSDVGALMGQDGPEVARPEVCNGFR